MKDNLTFYPKHDINAKKLITPLSLPSPHGQGEVNNYDLLLRIAMASGSTLFLSKRAVTSSSVRTSIYAKQEKQINQLGFRLQLPPSSQTQIETATSIA